MALSWQLIAPHGSAAVDKLTERMIFGLTTGPYLAQLKGIIDELYRLAEERKDDPSLCVHANEVPAICSCDDSCYCKDHTCKLAGT